MTITAERRPPAADGNRPLSRPAATTVHWEDVAQRWGESRPQPLWRRYCDLLHTALIERWLPAGSLPRLLKTDLFDETASDGLYPVLQRRADLVVGTDVATTAAVQARTRYPGLGATAGDARRLPFADGSFDAIVSNSTLDHFERLDEVAVALGELARVTRPGGTLILTLDNLTNPIVALRSVLPARPMRRLGLVPYFVGATCGVGRLRTLVTDAGFSVTHAEPVMHCPRVVAVAVARLLEHRGSPAAHAAYLRHLAAYERIAAWPTGQLTGYFTAIRGLRDGAR